jgi:chromosome segregation ATPase
MKLIPSYQEFVYDLPLQGKISPKLAESLAADFEEIGSINEGFLDSIKNALSKTFLGSLSHLNMIDQSREILLKAKKELLMKKYAHEDEMESLNNNLKQAQKTGNEATVATINKTILNKENEYKTYVKMVNKGIEKSEDTLVKVIEGNRRRKEYCEAGQSEDELELAELEYKLAKERSEADPKKIEELEDDIEKKRKEAEEARERLKKEEEEAKKKLKKNQTDSDIDPAVNNQNPTPATNKLIREVQDMQNKLNTVEQHIKDLEDKRDNEGRTLTSAEKMDLNSKKNLKKEYKAKLKDLEKSLTRKGKTSNKRNTTVLKMNRAASTK